MSTARDMLIADWRDRLDAAEAEPVASSPRRAWLARVRTRLYRFLLALYGDGTWRAGERPSRNQPVIFDSVQAESLAGKPAKDIGKIRSVLKTVANSQDHRPAAGSLTADEVISGCWFAVAAASTHLDPKRCLELLRHHHLECRLQSRGDDTIVEVPGPLRYEAMELIDKQRASLRKKYRVIGFIPLSNSPSVRVIRQPSSPLFAVLLFLTASLLAMLVLSMAFMGPHITEEELWSRLIVSLITAAVCGVALLWTWWRGRSAVVLPHDHSI